MSEKISPQLGKDVRKLSAKELAKAEKSECFVSKKYDGACVLVDYDGENLSVYTREGKDIIWDTIIMDELKAYISIYTEILQSRVVLVCELTVGEGKLGGRNKANGVVISSIASTKKNGFAIPETAFKLRIFDIVVLNQLSASRYVRHKWLINYDSHNHIFVRVEMTLTNWTMAKEIAYNYIANGYEGAMIHSADAKYAVGLRNSNYIKIKAENSIKGVVVNYSNGTGKYEGAIGSVLVRTTSETSRYVTAGSGLSDMERKLEAKIIGRECIIFYESIDKKSGKFLQPAIKLMGGRD